MSISKKSIAKSVFMGILIYGLYVVPQRTSVAGAPPGTTFEADVAPILRQSCQICHHPGGVAPMSLVTYEECRPWARSIKEQVAKRMMPPFYAAGPIGYYQEDIRLNKNQIDTISAWVDSGAPRGTPSNSSVSTTWDFDDSPAKPDLLLTPRNPYTVSSNGIDDYQVFAFDYTFPEDTWINKIDLRPGNRSAVHHIGLYALPAGVKVEPDGRVPDSEASIMQSHLILFWVPGSLPRVFEDRTAMLLPKGTRLGIQVHYAPNKRAGVVDQSSVAIYFANGIVNQLIHNQYGGVSKIAIPPGESHYELVDYKKFKTDALITAFGAHMHLRGKSFKISLIYPDGSERKIFDLPQFQFYWQRGYRLANPIRVPKGTIAKYTAVWDNSDRNALNPDPKQFVRFGLKTTDEMMASDLVYVIPEEKLNIHVEKGLRVDQEKSVVAPARQ